MLLKNEMVADIDALERALEARFSYLRAGSLDHRELFAGVRERLPGRVDVPGFGLELQKLLAHFIDGHAGVNAVPSPSGFLPFLAGSVAGALVAYLPDRSSLLDAQRPYLAAIDGLPVDAWLAVAATYVPSGSPQFVRRNSLVWLRAVQMLRGELGLPVTDEVEVTVASEAGLDARTLRLPVSERAPQFGAWPRNESRVLEGNVGYLRLAGMTSAAAKETPRLMRDFAKTAGLVVDVRGNGGGSRDALRALLPLLMAPEDEPRVVNVAAYRAWERFPQDHLANRYLYPVSSERWANGERAAVEKLMVGFVPEWRLPAGEFSAWHAMVVTPEPVADAAHYLNHPVVVLMDAACFSATDVFLSALKGVANVTLVGEASGGGSARAQVVELPASGLKARFASMASFQASGELFDGRGVHPDVVVEPGPAYFVNEGRDVVLERGMAVIAGALQD